MLVQGGEVQVHQRRSVDVDVHETRIHRFPRQVENRLGLLLRILAKTAGVELEVIALDKDRSAPVLPQGGRGDHGGVLRRTLLGVADLRAGNLENDRAGIITAGGTEHRPGRVVGQAPDVDGRDREPGAFAPAPGCVKLLDGSRVNSLSGGGSPNHPACRIPHSGVGGEDRRGGQFLQVGAPQGRRIQQFEFRLQLNDSSQFRGQLSQ